MSTWRAGGLSGGRLDGHLFGVRFSRTVPRRWWFFRAGPPGHLDFDLVRHGLPLLGCAAVWMGAHGWRKRLPPMSFVRARTDARGGERVNALDRAARQKLLWKDTLRARFYSNLLANFLVPAGTVGLSVAAGVKGGGGPLSDVLVANEAMVYAGTISQAAKIYFRRQRPFARFASESPPISERPVEAMAAATSSEAGGPGPLGATATRTAQGTGARHEGIAATAPHVTAPGVVEPDGASGWRQRRAARRRLDPAEARALALARANQSDDDDLSFFSSHTSTTAAFAFAVSQIATRRRVRTPLVFLLGIAAGLTGYLRIASDRHYLTDVLAGGLVGATVGTLVPRWLHPVRKQEPFWRDMEFLHLLG